MSEMISSHANPQIKAIRKLTDRKERNSRGEYLAEGLRIVIEAIRLDKPIKRIIYSPDLLRSEIGWEAISNYEVKYPENTLRVSEGVFRSITQKDNPQGAAAVIQQQWIKLDSVNLAAGSLWVALHQVADPGNLGAILRSMDGVAAEGLILLDQCTDPYDPSSIRASMGAVLTRKLVKTTFEEFKAWIEKTKVPVIGTSDKAKVDFHTYSYPEPMILLMGSERQGLDKDLQGICSAMVSIPMRGNNDSLNLAVATGIVLYEIDRQRNAPGFERG